MKILLLNHVNSCLTVVFLTVLPSTIFRDLECSCWNVLRVEIHWNWISRSKNHWNYFRRTFTGNMAYHKFMVFSGKNLPQSNSKEVFGLDRQSHEIRGTSLSPVIYFRLLLAAYHRNLCCWTSHCHLTSDPNFLMVVHFASTSLDFRSQCFITLIASISHKWMHLLLIPFQHPEKKHGLPRKRSTPTSSP